MIVCGIDGRLNEIDTETRILVEILQDNRNRNVVENSCTSRELNTVFSSTIAKGNVRVHLLCERSKLGFDRK